MRNLGTRTTVPGVVNYSVLQGKGITPPTRLIHCRDEGNTVKRKKMSSTGLKRPPPRRPKIPGTEMRSTAALLQNFTAKMQD
jgi:hypothetical protein